MRKWLAVFVVVIVILTLLYWMIPAKIDIHQKRVVAVNTKAFTRLILDEKKWQLWWPDYKTTGEQSPAQFEYKGNVYSVKEKKLTSLVIEVAHEKDTLLTELIFIPSGSDTVQLNWVGAERTGLNPVDRIHTSIWLRRLDADLHSLLEKISSFSSNEDNVYGIHLQNSLVADSNYVFTSIRSEDYPSTEAVYHLVDRLNHYIQINNARATGYPMLNVFRDSDSEYVTKVALPVDKQLKDSGDIQYRWMLKGGNILVTEVKGGPQLVERAFDAMQNYLEDHQRIAPAIPFQSLITNRRQEPDTNKWITKLYWPEM
jgi:hypothetical protein